MVRIQGRRALVEVAHTDLGPARQAWNGPLTPAGQRPSFGVRTVRTWGTLRLGKIWLAQDEGAGPSARPS